MTVGIVNDSRMATEVLRRVLATCEGFTVLWSAASGEEAIRLCAAQTPEILLMDLVMPGMNGAETTRRIMQATPCVILVVTATTVGNRDMVFEAMGYGALDAINTPTLGTGGAMSGADPLLRKLQTVSRFVTVSRSGSHTHSTQPHPQLADTSTLPIVAIGASTGGPQALAEVLSHLPEHFPAVVLIAQHVDEQFAPGLAAWLQHHTLLPVCIAANRQPLAASTIWLAGTNDHLIYERGGFATYTPHPEELAHRPSIDVLFQSLTLPHNAMRIGVLLTGMGRDGAQGLLALRKSGALTLTQDAATSIVYGMPKAAAELDAAAEILPLPAIGPRIVDAILHYRPSKP
jgi:two-component system response regulator WspF